MQVYCTVFNGIDGQVQHGNKFAQIIRMIMNYSENESTYGKKLNITTACFSFENSLRP